MGWGYPLGQYANLKAFLSIGLSPVFCAITHDQNGQLLNTNADTIAATVASALAADYEVYLHYCFGHAGVLKDIQRRKQCDSHHSSQRSGRTTPQRHYRRWDASQIAKCRDGTPTWGSSSNH